MFFVTAIGRCFIYFNYTSLMLNMNRADGTHSSCIYLPRVETRGYKMDRCSASAHQFFLLRKACNTLQGESFTFPFYPGG